MSLPAGSRRVPLLAVLGATLFELGCFASQYRTNPRVATVNGDPIVQMAPLGHFPSATAPPMVGIDRHSDPPNGKERLVGLVAEGESRAYPIGLLDRFEIVNDGMADLPYAVVRCALTHVAAVYDRRAGERTLSFENSGALWRDTLVMRDRETGTLWSAATGAGLFGPLAGQRLARVAAVYATARAWREAYPASLYMDMGTPTSVPFLMRLYAASPWQGISKIPTRDRRHPPKEKLLAVGAEGEALAFTEEQIRAAGSLRAELGGEAISIEWDPLLETGRAYSLPPTGDRREHAVIPMYWFALDRHFLRVRSWDP